MPAASPLIEEVHYSEDSAIRFAKFIKQPWSVLLDSAHPYGNQGRYDIFATDPYITLVTEGQQTEIRTRFGVSLSSDDPFQIVRKELGKVVPSKSFLPFCGGAIGYFGYDLARRLELLPAIALDEESIPEMMVGIYDWAVVVDHHAQRTWLVGQGRDPETRGHWSGWVNCLNQSPQDIEQQDFHIKENVKANMSFDDYAKAFLKIKKYILEGDCYQVNLAQRFSTTCHGDPWLAYRSLRKVNPAPFSGYLNFPPVKILCSSPERFLQVDDGHVETKPIKGTRPRKKNAKDDQREIEILKDSLKDRVENLMIVDLLRNDISKNCKLNSVRVPKLFDVESFATVHHLVSTVCGELIEGRHSLDLLRDGFPGGSITGAPKLRAMEIIEELEPHRRGIYCGSLAYVGFDGNMDSNITIRTLVQSDQTIRFWAGGGIVADSELDAEYQECFDKADAILRLMEQIRANTG